MLPIVKPIAVSTTVFRGLNRIRGLAFNDAAVLSGFRNEENAVWVGECYAVDLVLELCRERVE